MASSNYSSNSLRRQPKPAQKPNSAPRARSSVMPSQSSVGPSSVPNKVSSTANLGTTTAAEAEVASGPLGRVPAGISHTQKMSMMDGILDKYQDCTNDYDDFLTLVELVCDPDNNTLGIFPSSEESEEEEEGFDGELKAILEEPKPLSVAKKIDFDENEKEESDIEDEYVPKCIVQLRAFRKANSEYWRLREQLREREHDSQRRQYLEALATLVEKIELEVLPALNKAIKHPIAPAELAKSHGTTGIVCPVEDQEELIQELKTFTTLCEQFTNADPKKLNIEQEVQFLAEKVTFLEKMVTDEAAERLQFQRLREYLKKLDEEITIKCE